jgi:tRNA (guanine37-N1)-methyltransferase
MKHKLEFDIITIFPEIFGSYFQYGVIKRALEREIIGINFHNLRDYTTDKHRTVDDSPYGGGAGMILKIEPIWKIVQKLKRKKNFNHKNSRIILLSAKGRIFSQNDAQRLKKYKNLILICGRYEGVDERVADHIADEEISVGKYVLTGGELPAMTIIDSITRLIPDVLGNSDSVKSESYSSGSLALEHPQYTRPEVFKKWKVPKTLIEGHHEKINEWRQLHSKSLKK